MNATDQTIIVSHLAESLRRAVVEIAAPIIAEAARGEISSNAALVRIAVKIQVVTGCSSRDAAVTARSICYSMIRGSATVEPVAHA